MLCLLCLLAAAAEEDGLVEEEPNPAQRKDFIPVHRIDKYIDSNFISTKRVGEVKAVAFEQPAG